MVGLDHFRQWWVMTGRAHVKMAWAGGTRELHGVDPTLRGTHPPSPPWQGLHVHMHFKPTLSFIFHNFLFHTLFFSFLFFIFSINKKKKRVKGDNQYSFLFGAYCSSTLFVLGWNSIFSVCEKFIYYFLNYLR